MALLGGELAALFLLSSCLCLCRARRFRLCVSSQRLLTRNAVWRANCGNAELGLGVVCVRGVLHLHTQSPPPVSTVFAMKRAKALRIPRACGMYRAFVEQ